MIAHTEIQRLNIRAHLSQAMREEQALPKKLTRISVITLVAILITVAISVRLVYMNTASNSFLAKQMSYRVSRTLNINAMRGSIVDRNDNPLAVSTPVASIWIDPSELDQITQSQVKQLATILGLSVIELNDKLNQKNKTFVYLKRGVSPDQANLVKALGIEGVYAMQEYKRFYPDGQVTAHVVGFTNVDDNGSEGIEYADNKDLIGHNGSEKILRDQQGHVIDNKAITSAKDGKNIQLSIDNQIQFVAYDALKKQVSKYHAKGGSAVVLDAKSGEVLAMVNMPTYNPNNREGVTLDSIRNRAAIDLYEPGSTIKPFIAAYALDKGVVRPTTVFDTHPYVVGPKQIKDVHTSPSLNVAQIIQKSSDVGISKIAFKFSPEQIWTFDRELGFGQKVGTKFPGEARGILLPWANWRPIDQASISYGYAISVSLMQMARAYTLFTNNGCLLPVTFYKEAPGTVHQCSQAISPQTAKVMRDILSSVTEEGTGVYAQVDGYTTAGKTGTAHKATNHGYMPNNYVGSFIGFAPAKNPKIIVAVMIDDPHGQYYGGVVAAPVFSEIAGPTLKLLGVAPDKVATSNKKKG